MAISPTYPAQNYDDAVELTIFSSNQFHLVLQGDVDTEVPTYEGNGNIPSVSKALNEMAAYKVPIAWSSGSSETDLMQPRLFADYVYVPTISPALMDAAPDNTYWKLYMSEAIDLSILAKDHLDDGSHIVYETIENLRDSTEVPFANQVIKVVPGFVDTVEEYKLPTG